MRGTEKLATDLSKLCSAGFEGRTTQDGWGQWCKIISEAGVVPINPHTLFAFVWKSTVLTAGPKGRSDIRSLRHQCQVMLQDRLLFFSLHPACKFRVIQWYCRGKKKTSHIIHWISTVESNKLKKQEFDSDSQASWKLQRFHKSKSKGIQMSRWTTATLFCLTALVSVMNPRNPTDTQDSIF